MHVGGLRRDLRAIICHRHAVQLFHIANLTIYSFYMYNSTHVEAEGLFQEWEPYAEMTVLRAEKVLQAARADWHPACKCRYEERTRIEALHVAGSNGRSQGQLFARSRQVDPERI
jgi:hypothetical protein